MSTPAETVSRWLDDADKNPICCWPNQRCYIIPPAVREAIAALVKAERERAEPNTLADHKWLDPECGANGCQSLVWKSRYESAVKGRQDFRAAYRTAHHANPLAAPSRATSPLTGDEMSEPTFKRGDIVETVKGAKFWGRVVSLDDDPDSQPGATVLAFHPEFAGTKHVYPLKQLRHRTPAPVRAEGEATVTGPYMSPGEVHSHFRVYANDRIIAAVYAVDGDEDRAERDALLFAAALKAEDSL